MHWPSFGAVQHVSDPNLSRYAASHKKPQNKQDGIENFNGAANTLSQVNMILASVRSLILKSAHNKATEEVPLARKSRDADLQTGSTVR